MIRSFRYRLSPTRAQERVLFKWLDATRELYNAGLQERRDVWKKQRVGITEYDQFRELPAVREARPDIAAVPTVVLRGTLSRLDKSFKNFFRRVKAKEVPGYPRFKNRDRFTSILIDDFSWLNRRGGKQNPIIIGGGKRVALPSAIGKVKLKMHRPLEGIPKGLRILIDNGRWFISFFCIDVQIKELPKTRNEIGIDLGLETFVATSNGELIENPRFIKNSRIIIERAQRRMIKRKSKSKRRNKTRQRYARAHARVRNQRREFHIKTAKKLVAANDVIYVEAITILGLSRSMLGKSVHDVGWGLFLDWLRSKAESAGREVVEVDPRNTSNMCSGCGVIEKKTMKIRTHSCVCGLVLDRDVNAALNILKLGKSLRRDALPVRGRQRPAEVKSERAQRRAKGDS